MSKQSAGIQKTTYEHLTIIFLVGGLYLKSDHDILGQPFVV
jgi:hypothetical protein